MTKLDELTTYYGLEGEGSQKPCHEYILFGATTTMCPSCGQLITSKPCTVLDIENPMFKALWTECVDRYNKPCIPVLPEYRGSDALSVCTRCRGWQYIPRNRAEVSLRLPEAAKATHSIIEIVGYQAGWLAVVNPKVPSGEADNWLDALVAALLKVVKG